MKMVYCNTVDSKDLVLAFQSRFVCYKTCEQLATWTLEVFRNFRFPIIILLKKKTCLELDCQRHLAHSLAPKLSLRGKSQTSLISHWKLTRQWKHLFLALILITGVLFKWSTKQKLVHLFAFGVYHLAQQRHRGHSHRTISFTPTY